MSTKKNEIARIIQRMLEITGAKNERSLAHLLNTSPQNISSWKFRKRKPYAECELIARRSNVTIDWLLTGEGPMYRHQADHPVDADDEGLAWVPHHDVGFAAGWGGYPEDHVLTVSSRAFRRDWITSKGLQPDKLALVRVAGDSMEPVLEDKDIVMINRAETRPVTTMPLAFRLESALYIKMCQHDGDGGLQMLSANSNYPPIVIDADSPPADFEIIGAVVWHAHSWL